MLRRCKWPHWGNNKQRNGTAKNYMAKRKCENIAKGIGGFCEKFLWWDNATDAKMEAHAAHRN